MQRRAFFPDSHYEPVSDAEVRDALSTAEKVAEASLASRLSLSGTQRKLGLAKAPDPTEPGEWLRPLGGAASTHILKAGQTGRIPELEFLAMTAAAACSLSVPHVSLLAGKPGQVILCEERFDRVVSVADDDALHVARCHQEDMTQALGLFSSSKYAELDPSSVTVVSELLREHSSRPLTDVRALIRLVLFNYLIGNCDNHLKNISLLHEDGQFGLAPAYDLAPTAIFGRFSREMGMAIGRHRMLDEVEPEDFSVLARAAGMSPRATRVLAAEMVDAIIPAFMEAGEAADLEILPYNAEDLIDDMQPRLRVLEKFIGRIQ